MQLDIITPDRKVYEGEAKEVYLPGVDGSFELLDNHAAMVSALAHGQLTVTTTAEGVKNYQIHGGVVEVNNNKVTILAEGISE